MVLRGQTLAEQGLAEPVLGALVAQAMLGMQAAQATPAVAADIAAADIAAAEKGKGRLDVGGTPKGARRGPPLFVCVANLLLTSLSHAGSSRVIIGLIFASFSSKHKKEPGQ